MCIRDSDCSMEYSDAVLTVIEHLTSGRFEGRSELETYLYQIFTNKCVDLIRRNTTKKAQVHLPEQLTDSLNLLPDDARSVEMCIRDSSGTIPPSPTFWLDTDW